MQIGIWRYRADILPDTEGIPPTYYRGYVEHYTGNRKMQYPCERVRSTRAEAIKDARKLMKNLNH